MFDKASGLLKSNTAREWGGNLLTDVIGIFTHDPATAWSLARDLKSLPSAIRDGIFYECLETFLMNTYQYNEETGQFEAENLKSLAAALAEASPNYEAGYEGDPERLAEYAKRLIKLIDDCGTKQKAYYLACLTRALLAHQIDTNQFFQLSRCIRNLTEEDLAFLGESIQEGILTGEEDYIDDYRSLSLLRETDGGFAYTKRAFELKKYVLKYESHVEIPQQFPQRTAPYRVEGIPDKQIDELIEDVKNIRENQELGMI